MHAPYRTCHVKYTVNTRLPLTQVKVLLRGFLVGGPHGPHVVSPVWGGTGGEELLGRWQIRVAGGHGTKI